MKSVNQRRRLTGNQTKTSYYYYNMGILTWIVLGLIAGALAKFIMPGRDPGGIFVTIIIGILGAVVGGYIGTLLGIGGVNSLDLAGILIATGGSILLLFIFRIARRK